MAKLFNFILVAAIVVAVLVALAQSSSDDSNQETHLRMKRGIIKKLQLKKIAELLKLNLKKLKVNAALNKKKKPIPVPVFKKRPSSGRPKAGQNQPTQYARQPEPSYYAAPAPAPISYAAPAPVMQAPVKGWAEPQRDQTQLPVKGVKV